MGRNLRIFGKVLIVAAVRFALSGRDLHGVRNCGDDDGACPNICGTISRTKRCCRAHSVEEVPSFAAMRLGSNFVVSPSGLANRPTSVSFWRSQQPIEVLTQLL